jgi:hypothetical protein
LTDDERDKLLIELASAVAVLLKAAQPTTAGRAFDEVWNARARLQELIGEPESEQPGELN